MLRTHTPLMAIVAALALIASTVLADTITLNDGTVREGRIVTEDESGIVMEVVFGSLRGRVRIPKSDISSVKREALPKKPALTQAERLRSEARKLKGSAAAEAWVRLGDHYASLKGYSSESKAAYREALKADPEHADAHKRLGHTKTEKGWRAVDDERRKRGLVPLDDLWVKPAERAWLIDRRHDKETDDLRIGPRKEDRFTKKELEDQLRLKKAEEEYEERERLRLKYGESLLSRYGYFLPAGDTFYIGSANTPYYADGVGIAYGDSDFFVGHVGSGYHPYHRYRSYRRCANPYGYGYRYGFSPGIVYRDKNFSFGFGTNFGGYGYPYGGYGYGFRISGGNKNFKYNLNWGGFSGRSSYRGYSGFGF